MPSPAWCQMMWFSALEAFGPIIAAFLIVQTCTVILRAQQRELEALVDDRTPALVRANDERNSLIDNPAHDLRTPLFSLRLTRPAESQ